MQHIHTPSDIQLTKNVVLKEKAVFYDVGVQTDAVSSLRVIERTLQLRRDVEDSRVNKALLEKRTARKLQELQELVQSIENGQDPVVVDFSYHLIEGGMGVPGSLSGEVTLESSHHSTLQPSVEPQLSGTQVHNAHSDLTRDLQEDAQTTTKGSVGNAERSVAAADVTMQEPYPAALYYVQRVAGLEQQTAELRIDLEQLHECERSLRAENAEKNALIARLMVKAGLNDLTGFASRGPRSVSGEHVVPFWRRERGDKVKDVQELQSIIEETTEDNIRLRNDIQVMAADVRKALAA